MTSIPEPTLNIQDVPKLFSKYWPSMLMSTLVSMIVFTVAASYVPKKYKAHFVLTIYSKYFQSPLVGDFVPEMSESSEMRSQRESLIRQVLTPDYLDALGKKYDIYTIDAVSGTGQPSLKHRLAMIVRSLATSLDILQPAGKDSELSQEREDLRMRIQIDAVNPSTFNVGFVYSDPSITLQVTNDLYREIIQSLLEIRMRILSNVHDAIQNRVSSLSANITANPTPTSTAPAIQSGTDMVEEELANVRSQIQQLTAQYTEEHPLVIQLRDRERILVARLESLQTDGSPSARSSNRPTSSAGSRETTRDIYGDLSKKLSYLNIAIDTDKKHQNDYFAVLETPLYPSAPLWPKRGMFAIWGIGLGLFGSLFVAAIREYYERSTLHASNLAEHMSLPLLGELPAFPPKASR